MTLKKKVLSIKMSSKIVEFYKILDNFLVINGTTAIFIFYATYLTRAIII